MFIIDLCGSIFVSGKCGSAFTQDVIFFFAGLLDDLVTLFWKLKILDNIVCKSILGMTKIHLRHPILGVQP